jgi:hypothetical protein
MTAASWALKAGGSEDHVSRLAFQFLRIREEGGPEAQTHLPLSAFISFFIHS